MTGADGGLRDQYAAVKSWLDRTPDDILEYKTNAAEGVFRRLGITFAVYTDNEAGSERLIPFDIIPRIIDSDEWETLTRGLEQRVRALNAFLHDVYHDREIVRAGKVDEARLLTNTAYVGEMQGLDPALGIYTHVCGIDLVRTDEDTFHVLEDNCRTPSGVSYMIENREVMMRLFPELFADLDVAPISSYPQDLYATLREAAPPAANGNAPTVVVLTPGRFNSAYYEHAFLADEMGVELVEGQDLVVEDGYVFMRTTEGRKRVDVIYRRIDDDFLDPLVFRPDSALGVPGLMAAYRLGRVTIANAPGAGIADDKAIYMLVPEMIRFYLGEEPILKNVHTWDCSVPSELSHVLANLDELVVKDVHGSGGYGMLVGPTSTKAERSAFAERLSAAPERYIAQPTLALSTCPTYVNQGVAPRHVDLRPFVLAGEDVRIVPGGLTRVALREGSLVVNSSQGGGTKDTWVMKAAKANRRANGANGIALHADAQAEAQSQVQAQAGV
ncbi:MAG: circularly permuted type 2 ATP-grasp protein [Maricaulaceae bacterium]|jgi:uncharacterized circularly permuted ATP-grasp superfamily protein